MKLIVGLGNPGKQYEATRHNVGFMVLDELARRFFADGPKLRFEAALWETRMADEKILLAAPQTFMNCSGRSVGQIVDFFKLSIDSLAVVCDDMNLDTGKLRWRARGSAGGQNGLNDIINHLGTDEFARLRIGIGRPPGRMAATDWVLGRFRGDEADEMELAIARAADSVEEWIQNGVESAMNRFNGGD